MDALCACCARPTPATTFPAVCDQCRATAVMVVPEASWIQEIGAPPFIPSTAQSLRFHSLLNPDPWLASLTVGDAAFLHDMKIDPLG